MTNNVTKDDIFSKDNMKLMVVNILESTFTPRVVSNLMFIIAKKYINQIIERYVQQINGVEQVRVTSRTEPYKLVSWEIEKTSNKL